MSEQNTAVEPIYHITTHELWSAVEESDRYAAPSLETEGFIHCSLLGQVERSLNRFFAAEASVIVLTIDPALLDAELRFEPAHGEQFPHIYGEIVLVAVTTAELVLRGDDGRYSYPPEV
jgi:uncharacterized protein (DUF952 family)